MSSKQPQMGQKCLLRPEFLYTTPAFSPHFPHFQSFSSWVEILPWFFENPTTSSAQGNVWAHDVSISPEPSFICIHWTDSKFHFHFILPILISLPFSHLPANTFFVFLTFAQIPPTFSNIGPQPSDLVYFQICFVFTF